MEQVPSQETGRWAVRAGDLYPEQRTTHTWRQGPLTRRQNNPRNRPRKGGLGFYSSNDALRPKPLTALRGTQRVWLTHPNPPRPPPFLSTGHHPLTADHLPFAPTITPPP